MSFFCSFTACLTYGWLNMNNFKVHFIDISILLNFTNNEVV